MQDRVLAGRYRLETQLGQGGMGSVWRAEHLTLHSAVAVKLMDPAIAATPDGADRFRREAQAAASLRSAHVVQVLDYGVDEGTPYLVMELLNGENLASCLEREGRLSPERTLAIMTQVARAMARAHGANIVHRDLKPENIFLVREDDQELVKVLDFGIAKTSESGLGGPKTRTGVTMGTPHYMSPEQAEGKRAVDQRTDLWAMAVIICECITGLRPFRGETWGELLLNICARPIPVPSTHAEVPPGFDAWFSKATSREPEQRFGSAQELISTLRTVLGGSALGAAPAPGPGGGSRPSPEAPMVASAGTPGSVALDAPSAIPMKKSTLPLAFGLGMVAVVAVGGTVLLRGRSPTPEPLAGPSASVSAPSSPESATPARALASERATPSSPRPVRAAGPMAAAAPKVSAAEPAPKEVPGGRSSRASTLGSTALTAAPLARPSAGEPPASKNLRCYTDPFTGMIKLEGAGHTPPGPQAFPCKQNPFTGQYQRQ